MANYYEKHIFVCENKREIGKRVSCGHSNSTELRNYLKEQIALHISPKKIRVNMSGCLDRCEQGPIVLSYPEGEWFCLKSKEDADRFIESYILNKNDVSIEELKVMEN
jgi:(2Fe-2S) ferredoxin